MSDRKGITEITAPVASGNPNTPLAVHFANEDQGGMKIFDSKAERDSFTKKFRVRCYKSVAIVGKGENDFPSIYHWTGTQSDGSDGSWEFAGYYGGVVLADADGAIPKLRATIVLGEDFEIEEAGDQGFGALIQLSDTLKSKIAKIGTGKGTESSGVTFEERKDYKEFRDITRVMIGPGLNLNELRDTPQGPTTGISIEVVPGMYERHHVESYLAYFDMDDIIIGKVISDERKGAIWPMKVAYGGRNIALYPDLTTKSMSLQDPFNDDPSVTGGAPIFCGLHLGFYGKAPDDGQIEIYLCDAESGEVLLDDKGQPIGTIHHYKSGDKIAPITIGQIYVAKQIIQAQWRVKHTFTDDPVRMGDWAVDSSCMLYQVISDNESISPALNEFQHVIGGTVRIMKKYYGVEFATNKWVYGFNIKQSIQQPNTGQDSITGLDFENPTIVKAALENSVLNIKDDGSHMVLFNTGIELSPEDSRNLTGKAVEVNVHVFNRYNGVNLAMFTYTGDMANVSKPILKDQVNDQYVLSDGWQYHDHAFLPEHSEGGFHPINKEFIIPTQAKIVMFGVLPSKKQTPCDISIKPMNIDVVNPFTAYEVEIPKISDALMFNSVSSSFTTYNKIWHILKTKTNVPFGEKVNKTNKADVELSVIEDDENAYNGGIKLNKATTYAVEVWLSVINFFKTNLTDDEVVNFWVEDSEGNKITNSDSPTLTLKNGDFNSHIIHWRFIYDNKKPGTIIKLYGKGSNGNVAFLAQGTDSAAGVIIDEKVLP
ncbi:TPA: hypothetical protein ACX6NV_000572 [Photobacterium damselae]